MDGFTFLRIVMSKRPTPVIVISGRSGEQDVFKALELGAVDFIAKPTPRAAPELESTSSRSCIRKVHAIRELRIEKVRERLESPMPRDRRAAASEAPARRRAGGDRLLDRWARGADADLRRLRGGAAAAPSWWRSTCRRASRAASPSASTA